MRGREIFSALLRYPNKTVSVKRSCYLRISKFGGFVTKYFERDPELRTVAGTNDPVRCARRFAVRRQPFETPRDM